MAVGETQRGANLHNVTVASASVDTRCSDASHLSHVHTQVDSDHRSRRNLVQLLGELREREARMGGLACDTEGVEALGDFVSADNTKDL